VIVDVILLRALLVKFQLKTMIFLLAICSIALAAWAYMNRPVSVSVGMSEDFTFQSLDHVSAVHTPPIVDHDSIDRTSTSIRYWYERSHFWAIDDQSVVIATAFDDEELVHLMIWEYKNEPQRKDGLASAVYKPIQEFEISGDGSVYAIKSVD
jgi:hypothetical protein